MSEQADSRAAEPNGWRISRWTQQWVFTWKELCETLRDRRTTVTLIVMPVLLYPLLGLMFRFMAVGEMSKLTPEYRIALETEQEASWLSSLIQSGHEMLQHASQTSAGNSKGLESEAKIQFLVPSDGAEFDLEKTTAEGLADLGIRVTFSDRQIGKGFPGADMEFFEVENSPRSRDAAIYVRQRMIAANLLTATNTIRSSGQQFDLPVRDSTHWVKPLNQTAAILGLLPLVLLLMTVTGGVYPAIDLTAGERERDTLETVMALPVSKVRLLMAKYVAVLTVTMLTGLMNITAMSVTVYALQMESTLFGDTGLTVSLILRLCSVLLVFSLFYSAILLLVTSSARSFKEAQALLIPLMLMTIAPGLVIMLPGWRLEGWLTVLPVVNILLMARELLEGTLNTVPALMAVTSTLLSAGTALSLAAGLFGTDAVLTGSRTGWKDFLRRPREVSNAASASIGLTTLAILFPLHFLASGFLSRFSGADFSMRLMASATLTVVLFAGLPLILMKWLRVLWRSGASLHCPSIRVWPGVILIGVSAWPWIYELVILLQSAGLQALDEAKLTQVKELLEACRRVPIALVLVSLGVLPGLCEELFFRGFLLSSLRREKNAGAAIAVAAICFGLFHVVLAGGAAPERLLPSTLMGLLLGWVAFRSGSVIPAMVLHVIHNSTLLLITHFNQELSPWAVGGLQQTHLPGTWLIAAALLLVIGLVLMFIATRNRGNRSVSFLSTERRVE
jgi:sodium transport system permease protein